MVKERPFLRWFLFATLMSVCLFFVNKLGFFESLRDNDFTFIGFGIVALFVFMSIISGIRTKMVSLWSWKDNNFYDKNNKLVDSIHVREVSASVWFSSAICTTLGMIGTVLGMIVAFSGFGGLDANDPAAVQATITYLAEGVNAALYTTFVGLVASLLLKLQAYHLDYSIREKK